MTEKKETPCGVGADTGLVVGRHANAAGPQKLAQSPARVKTQHETGDAYDQVVATPCEGWRVIVCKGGFQWILQRRKGGGEWPWRATGYFRTRKALMRVTAASCGALAAEALASLPETFSKASKKSGNGEVAA